MIAIDIISIQVSLCNRISQTAQNLRTALQKKSDKPKTASSVSVNYALYNVVTQND